MKNTAGSVLRDPAYRVPMVPAASDGVAWLRANVARFSEGSDHGRRRALAVAQLAAAKLEQLRTGDGDPIDILAEALGLPREVAADVATVAESYPPHAAITAGADEALARLVAACGGNRDEATASRIGLLVQACTATAALIAGATRQFSQRAAWHRPVRRPRLT